MDQLNRLTRDVKSLAEGWLFQLDQDDVGMNKEWFSPDFDRSGWLAVSVPGAWDFYGHSYWGYEGVGWYSADIPANWVSSGEWQSLAFESVGGVAKVWLNGVLLGGNECRYLPFEWAVSELLKSNGPNTLVVRVDNVLREHLLPGSRVIEWVQYGGLLKPVSLITEPPCRISHLAVAAKMDGTSASVTSTIEICNAESADAKGIVRVRVLGETNHQPMVQTFDCPSGGTSRVTLTLLIPDAELWHPDTPHLYELEVELEQEGHPPYLSGKCFGVRSIQVQGTELLLNGERLIIRGVNRYDEYADYGPTVPEAVLREDLQRIKDMGGNAIRMHYPPDPLQLDIMDEIGLLMLEEIPLNWWLAQMFEQKPTLEDPASIIDLAEDAIERMVKRDASHPSVIIWSMCNECGTNTPVGIEGMRRLMRKTRELDPTRLVTFVTTASEGHDAIDEADLIAVNVYFGLFNGEVAQSIGDMDRTIKQPTETFLREVANRYPGKPIVIGEFGTHAIAGINGDVRFSETYQGAYLRSTWEGFMNVPEAHGGFLWAWADYYHRRNFIGSSPREWHAPYGPYGVVTIDRIEKSSLQQLSELFAERSAFPYTRTGPGKTAQM